MHFVEVSHAGVDHPEVFWTITKYVLGFAQSIDPTIRFVQERHQLARVGIGHFLDQLLRRLVADLRFNVNVGLATFKDADIHQVVFKPAIRSWVAVFGDKVNEGRKLHEVLTVQSECVISSFVGGWQAEDVPLDLDDSLLDASMDQFSFSLCDVPRMLWII